MVSTLALGATLFLGTAAAPALAKEEKKPAANAPSYKLSTPFRNAIAPAQAAIKAADTTKAAAAIDAADALAKEPDEKYIAAAVRLDLAGALKDKAMQGRAIEAMIASGSTPQAELAKLNFYAGNFAYERGDYPAATKYLGQADQLGYKDVNTYLLLAEANFKGNQIPTGLAAVEKAVQLQESTGQKAPQAWYARAASVAYKANMMSEASKWTRAQVKAYPTAENWRSALVIYRDGAKRDGNINLDLYRLMRATKSLDGERDYAEYAYLASDRGLPGETKAVIDEGTASGKVPATSRAISEIKTAATAKIATDRASLATSEKQAASAANGRIASNTGDAYLGYGDYAKAIALYRSALQKGGIDADQVNTRLGIALAQSGDAAAAKAAFALVKGERTEVAQFWTLYLDTPKV